MTGDYDLTNSFVIGDRITDVELAKNLGTKAIFLKEGEDRITSYNVCYTKLLRVPFVVAYIWYVWKAINNRPIDEEEMNSDDLHVY